jgi:hypothetical protein
MDSHGQRHVLHAVVLMGCVFVGVYGQDRTPTRDVVEMVSVVYKPARNLPTETPASLPADGGEPSAQVALSESLGPNELPEPAATVHRPRVVDGQGGLRPGHGSKALPERGLHAAAPAVKPSTNYKGVVRTSCRPAGCTEHAHSGKGRVKSAGKTARPQKATQEARLPAVLVPIRKLGLYLQARTGGPAREGT